MSERYCNNYCGVACVNGYCPVAQYRAYPELFESKPTCKDCFYYEGCEDCYFAETDMCVKKGR